MNDFFKKSDEEKNLILKFIEISINNKKIKDQENDIKDQKNNIKDQKNNIKDQKNNIIINDNDIKKNIFVTIVAFLIITVIIFVCIKKSNLNNKFKNKDNEDKELN